MEYAKKVAETPPVDNTNTANTANTPPEGWRNPWRGAAIGGTFGGLLTTALGYLYGHRGRWLAYDALAGGLTGGSAGYAIDSHNNQRAEDKQEKGTVPKPYTAEGARKSKELAIAEDKSKWENEDKPEYENIMKSGGFGGFWENLFKYGPVQAFRNYRAKNYYETARNVNANSYEEAMAEKARRNAMSKIPI